MICSRIQSLSHSLVEYSVVVESLFVSMKINLSRPITDDEKNVVIEYVKENTVSNQDRNMIVCTNDINKVERYMQHIKNGKDSILFFTNNVLTSKEQSLIDFVSKKINVMIIFLNRVDKASVIKTNMHKSKEYYLINKLYKENVIQSMEFNINNKSIEFFKIMSGKPIQDDLEHFIISKYFQRKMKNSFSLCFSVNHPRYFVLEGTINKLTDEEYNYMERKLKHYINKKNFIKKIKI